MKNRGVRNSSSLNNLGPGKRMYSSKFSLLTRFLVYRNFNKENIEFQSVIF